jgi:hypothetical protein
MIESPSDTALTRKRISTSGCKSAQVFDLLLCIVEIVLPPTIAGRKLEPFEKG